MLTIVSLVLASVAAAGDHDGPAGSLAKKRGSVLIERMGATARAAARDAGEVFPGDKIVTGAGGGAQLALRDGAFLDLGELTEVRINQYAYEEEQRRRTTRVRVLKGSVRAVLVAALSADSLFLLETDQAVVALHQQAMAVVRIVKDATELFVLRDSAQVNNSNPYVVGSREVGRGMKTMVRQGAQPLPASAFRQEDWSRVPAEFGKD